MRKDKIVSIIAFLFCFLVMTVLSVLVMNQKEGFFLDEYYSYGCANSIGKAPDFENGVTYDQPVEMYNKIFSADPGSLFNYSQVWKNLSENVHPPLFYVVLHFICALFPGEFSKWFGLATNILFAGIALFFVFRLFDKTIRNQWVKLILLVAYTVFFGVYANVIFLRDYMAAMAGVTAFGYGILMLYREPENKKRCMLLAGTSLFCALSHNYCLIFLFFGCAVTGVLFVIKKNWKAIRNLVISELSAAAVTCVIFPHIVRQLLASKRGHEARDNLVSMTFSQTVDRIKFFFNQINQHIYGKMFIFVLLLIFIFGLLLIIRRYAKKNANKDTSTVVQGRDNSAAEAITDISWTELLILCLPSVLYFLLVARIAAYENMRYFYPIYAVVFAGGAIALQKSIDWIGKKKLLAVLMALFCLACSVRSWSTSTFKYLYTGQTERLQVFNNYTDKELLVTWRSYKGQENTLYPMIGYFSKATFYYRAKPEEMNEFHCLEEKKDFILAVEPQSILDELLQNNPGYEANPIQSPNVNGKLKWYDFQYTGKSAANEPEINE